MKVWVTFGEMGRTLKKRQLEKRRLFSVNTCVKYKAHAIIDVCDLYKMDHTKQGHSCKNWLHFLKLVTFGEMGHTCKNGSHLKTGSHLEKWVTLEKMCHLGRNGSPLQKMFYIWKKESHCYKKF